MPPFSFTLSSLFPDFLKLVLEIAPRRIHNSTLCYTLEKKKLARLLAILLTLIRTLSDHDRINDRS